MNSKTLTRAWVTAAVLATGSTALLFSSPTLQDQLDAAKLRAMIEGLGYTTKDLDSDPGKEKYEFKVVHDGLDIFIAAEVSPSKNYVWLTVFLGEAPKATAPASEFREMLKWNGKIQPTQFYITASERLMLGFAMENRSITPAVLRRTIDKLTKDVADSEDAWNK